MLWFPQLVPGTGMQFPGKKRILQRTVVNEGGDGRRVKLADPGAALVEWELELNGLTDAERAAIEALFTAAEGRLGTFGFLDPFGNLARWSEDFGAAVWEKPLELALSGGVTDPAGGTAAMQASNSGGGAAALRQTLSVPEWFQYAVSVWARSEAGAEVGLRAAGIEKTFAAGPAWRRLALAAKPGGAAETVDFEVAIGAGATIELFGFQVEPQSGASKYKRSTTRSGIFPSARFGDDALTTTAEGLNNHSMRVRIQAR